MPLIDHFGILAPYYERFIQVKHPDKLYTILGLPVKGALLDAGGGTGRISQFFYGSASQLIVADGSFGMLSQARSKNGLKTVCSHTENLPFPSGYFERVIMVDVFHHVEDHNQTIRELWRILKPNGRLVIEEPDIHQVPVKLIALFERIALMRSKFFKPESIADLFTYADARITIEREGINSWVIVDKFH